MMTKWKKLVKNQKGLTLVELLAVVVILGIIAAIAVPSIGNIIDNSKKDAHVSNAQQMLNAARLAFANNEQLGLENEYTLQDLINKGYIEAKPVHPNDNGTLGEETTPTYDTGASKVVVNSTATAGNQYKVSLKETNGRLLFKNASPDDLVRSKISSATN